MLRNLQSLQITSAAECLTKGLNVDDISLILISLQVVILHPCFGQQENTM